MRKVNFFLVVVALTLGAYLLHTQVFQEPAGVPLPAPPPQVVEPEPQVMTEELLIVQVRNKRFIESAYLALLYSKASNEQLLESLQAYLDENSKMTPEDVATLIEIHEKTFLNRHLKVFVTVPDPSIESVNASARRALHQIGLAYDTLREYGEKPQPVVPEPGVTPVEREPVFDKTNLRQGVHKLQETVASTREAMTILGEEDIRIERFWLKSGLTEEDLFAVLDRTNNVSLPRR